MWAHWLYETEDYAANRLNNMPMTAFEKWNKFYHDAHFKKNWYANYATESG